MGLSWSSWTHLHLLACWRWSCWSSSAGLRLCLCCRSAFRSRLRRFSFERGLRRRFQVRWGGLRGRLSLNVTCLGRLLLRLGCWLGISVHFQIKSRRFKVWVYVSSLDFLDHPSKSNLDCTTKALSCLKIKSDFPQYPSQTHWSVFTRLAQVVQDQP